MKVAVCFGVDQAAANATATAQRMANALVNHEGHESILLPCGSGVIAAVSNRDISLDRVLVQTSNSGNRVVVTGVPILADGGLESCLARIVELDLDAAAEELAQLEGFFAAIFWDERSQRLAIVTDLLGMQPLYIEQTPGRLLLATDLKGVTVAREEAASLDPAGWGAFNIYGYWLGADTSVEGVRRAPPGEVLVYEPKRGVLDSRQYWRWPEARMDMKEEDIDTGGLVEILERECAGFLEHASPGVVLLSGGLDSRLIAGVLRRMNASAPGLIFRHENEIFGADGRWAARVADACGMPYKLIAADREFYSSTDYLDYLYASEVHNPSLGLFVSTIFSAITPDLGAVWEGASLGTSLKTKAPPSLERVLAFKPTRRWRGMDNVFSPEVARSCRDALEDRLRQVQAELPDDGEGVMEFLNRHMKRNRQSPNPLKVYANRVPSFTPGVSRDFWNFTSAIPHRYKVDFRLYRLILERHFPDLLSIPAVSRGHSMSLGSDARWRASVHRASMKTARWLNRKRPTFGPSRWLVEAVASVDAGHPDLNPDGVRATQRRLRDDPCDVSREAELLFYWQAWRSMVQGRRLSNS